MTLPDIPRLYTALAEVLAVLADYIGGEGA